MAEALAAFFAISSGVLGFMLYTMRGQANTKIMQENHDLCERADRLAKENAEIREWGVRYHDEMNAKWEDIVQEFRESSAEMVRKWNATIEKSQRLKTLAEAEQEAERIIREVTATSERIVREAKSEARQIVEAAHQEASRRMDNAIAGIQMENERQRIPPGVDASEDAVWYYFNRDGEEIGPVSSQVLRQCAESKEVRRGTAIRRAGIERHYPAVMVAGLFDGIQTHSEWKEAKRAEYGDSESDVALSGDVLTSTEHVKSGNLWAKDDLQNPDFAVTKFSIIFGRLADEGEQNDESEPICDAMYRVFHAMLVRVDQIVGGNMFQNYLEIIAGDIASNISFSGGDDLIFSDYPALKHVGNNVWHAAAAIRFWLCGNSFLRRLKAGMIAKREPFIAALLADSDVPLTPDIVSQFCQHAGSYMQIESQPT